MLSTSRLLRFGTISCFVLLLRACAEGEGVEPVSKSDGSLGAGGGAGQDSEAGPDTSAGGAGGGGGTGGAGGADAGGDASSSGGSTDDAPSIDSSDAPPEAGGMDPDLSLPVASGQTCYVFGSPGECPLGQVCRLFSPTEGRCEACAPCGMVGAACASSGQCDVLYQCYLGACTNFCRIGQKCGAVADCVNVGHASTGVCPP